MNGIDAFGESFDIDVVDSIVHYGMPRRSGRYPWGSGENPYQHNADFIARYEELKKKGLSEVEIAQAMGCSREEGGKASTAILRAQLAIAKAERFSYQYDTAKSMREDGKTYQEIADRLGLPGESSARNILAADPNKRSKSFATAETIKSLVDEKGFIDVGLGVEHELHVSETKLKESLEILRQEGYEVYTVGLKQVTNERQQTPLRVVCPPGTSYADVYKTMEAGDIHSVVDYTKNDNGDLARDAPERPVSVDSSRVFVRYGDTGGTERDGLIEIRPGVKDLDLGASTYAQVRIGVDDTHYMKGMCIYGDPSEFPKGCDIIFNSNKPSGSDKDTVFKSMKDDPDNPFGALIEKNGQSHYIGDDGKEHLSPINKLREEGDWAKWEQGLPHQFLAKQKIPLIRQQLDQAYADKKLEYEEILSLTNPIVRRHYLKEFGDQCDADAVKMKGASLPGQQWKVLIPTTKLKDNEVYCPTHADGEEVALIRFPHQGTYEIPICRVNNKQADVKKMLGNATDAVAINKTVADRLSGADFDGDTVIVVPVGKSPATRITSTKLLEGLVGFDPKTAYATTKVKTGKKDEDGNDIYEYIGKNGKPVKIMSDTNNQMGRISNLVTDMTIKGATAEELARATRHAQVVIDAEKHKLDYKASFKDNDIAGLKAKYQGRIEDGRYTESASTIFSRAKSEVDVPETRGNPRIDPKTGRYLWEEKQTGRTYVDKSGKEVLATKKAHQMDTVTDARKLSSGFPKEEIYADYANHLKTMANDARKEYMATTRPKQNKEATKKYAAEVQSLKDKLALAESNSPRERQAQVLAGYRARAKKDANPDMTKSEYKKVANRELARARVEVGSDGKHSRIVVSDREWEAIQAGAVSSTVLEKILAHSDPDSLRKLATPRATTTLTPAKKNKIRLMAQSDYTISEIAKALGVSTSTVSKALKGEE